MCCNCVEKLGSRMVLNQVEEITVAKTVNLEDYEE